MICYELPLREVEDFAQDSRPEAGMHTFNCNPTKPAYYDSALVDLRAPQRYGRSPMSALALAWRKFWMLWDGEGISYPNLLQAHE